MGATIEVKYFNSFILKKINSGNDPIWNGSYGIPQTSPASTINGGYPQVTGASATNAYIVEEARIRGGFNNTSLDYGAKAYLVEAEPAPIFWNLTMLPRTEPVVRTVLRSLEPIR